MGGRFYRLFGTGREGFYGARFEKRFNSKGTGIGLSLVKRLVGRNNGEIYIENNNKKSNLSGAIFIISFPINSS